MKNIFELNSNEIAAISGGVKPAASAKSGDGFLLRSVKREGNHFMFMLAGATILYGLDFFLQPLHSRDWSNTEDFGCNLLVQQYEPNLLKVNNFFKRNHELVLFGNVYAGFIVYKWFH